MVTVEYYSDIYERSVPYLTFVAENKHIALQAINEQFYLGEDGQTPIQMTQIVEALENKPFTMIGISLKDQSLVKENSDLETLYLDVREVPLISA